MFLDLPMNIEQQLINYTTAQGISPERYIIDLLTQKLQEEIQYTPTRSIQQIDTMMAQVVAKRPDGLLLRVFHQQEIFVKYDLAEQFNVNDMIEMTGLASYIMQGFQMRLSDFQVYDINQCLYQDGQTWLDEFVACGESGWQKLEQPVETWLQERHSI